MQKRKRLAFAVFVLTLASAAAFLKSSIGESAPKAENDRNTAFEHDALGNLRSVSLPDGTKVEYVLDGIGRRLGKKVNGQLVQGFLYEGQFRPVAELDGRNNIVSRFVYANQVNLPEYMEKGGQVFRFVADHLGSPRLVIDARSGAIAQRLDYDEFGNVLRDTNPGFQPFGFAGGIYDMQTKLVHFGFRDYDPATGRWITKDPILFASGDQNLYEYVGNDPVNWSDPSGLADQGRSGKNSKQDVVPARHNTPYEDTDELLNQTIQGDRRGNYPVLPGDFPPRQQKPNAGGQPPSTPKAPVHHPKAKPKACPKGGFNKKKTDQSGVGAGEDSTAGAIRG